MACHVGIAIEIGVAGWTAIVELQWREQGRQLESKLQPRTITAIQIKDFIFLTEKFPKFQIRVVVNTLQSETFGFAVQIRDMLNEAGYGVPDSDTDKPYGIHYEPGAFSILPVPFVREGKKAPDIEFVSDRTNGFITFISKTEETNSFNRTIAFPNNTMENVYGAIIKTFEMIGMPCPGTFIPIWLGTNQCAIYVHEKPQ